jgi:hypothetical protein
MQQLEFNFFTMHVGTAPPKEPTALTEYLSTLLDIPCIPCRLQLPGRL